MSGTLAVVSQTSHSLSFFDVASGERLEQITNLTAEPHELAYDAKRNLLYVSHAYRHGHYWKHGDLAHEISIVDLATMSVVDIIDTSPAKAPHGLVLDAKQDFLYVCVEEIPGEVAGGIIGINLETRKIVKQAPSEYRTHWFVMTLDGKKAYCCNKTASFISIVHMENECMIGKIDVPSNEEPILSPESRFAYFPTPRTQFGKNPLTPEIKIIDTTTDEVVGAIKASRQIGPTHTTPSGLIITGDFIYKDEANSKNVARMTIYDPITHVKLGEAPIGLWPLTLRCSSDGKTAFISNVTHGTVTVVDLASLSVTMSLDVDVGTEESRSGHVGAHGLTYIP